MTDGGSVPGPVRDAAARALHRHADDTELVDELAETLHRMASSRDQAQCRDAHLRRVIATALDRLDRPPGVVHVLFCRVCDPNFTTPALHPSPADRGRWAAGHTRATGHDLWLVLDWDTPVEAARDAHYVSTYCIDADQKPDLHQACRKNCMHCGAPCRCSCHQPAPA